MLSVLAMENSGGHTMSQHVLTEQELEDQRTLRRLGLVISCFIAATAVMAVTITVIAG